MFSKVLKRYHQDKLVIIDPTFPQKEPFAFRNTEINEYLTRIKNVTAYAMYPMLPDEHAWFKHGYGMKPEEFVKNINGYKNHYPKLAKKIKHLRPNTKYSFDLAYSFFLAETYVLLPFYEKNKIPFVFVLYPGGAFGIDNAKSDRMLRRIFESPYFRGVIVTQRITKNYLIRKKLCSRNKIEYIFGGFVQFSEKDILPKVKYKIDKTTLDICFVAAKYSNQGVDKGYDLFVDVAKIIANKTPDVHFHVVGGFDRNEVDISGLDGRIEFYGYQKPDFLKEFYSKMDILLSPNRPFKLYEGNFDGFPIGADASYCGVALFVSDELNMNEHYKDKNDIVLISLNAKTIADNILYYYSNTGELYDLASRGQERSRKLFSTKRQINARMNFFKQFLSLELSNE